MLLVAFANLTYMPTLAAIESGQVLNQVGGQYGANLNNVTGATVNSNGVYANITNTQTNSTLNWNSLNTAPGQTLNFNMTAGQTEIDMRQYIAIQDNLYILTCIHNIRFTGAKSI